MKYTLREITWEWCKLLKLRQLEYVAIFNQSQTAFSLKWTNSIVAWGTSLEAGLRGMTQLIGQCCSSAQEVSPKFNSLHPGRVSSSAGLDRKTRVVWGELLICVSGIFCMISVVFWWILQVCVMFATLQTATFHFYYQLKHCTQTALQTLCRIYLPGKCTVSDGDYWRWSALNRV